MFEFIENKIILNQNTFLAQNSSDYGIFALGPWGSLLLQC